MSKRSLFSAAMLLSMTIAPPPAAHAMTEWDELDLTVSHLEFQEVVTPPAPTPTAPGHMPAPTGHTPVPTGRTPFPRDDRDDDDRSVGGSIASTVNTARSIINLGKDVWQIVEANKPVIETSANVATAVPQGTKYWTELEGWQNPQIHNYQMVLKNGYGGKVVSFDYQLQFNPGGNQAGRGAYISNATIRATHVDVVWGYKFSADVAVGDIVNVGTQANPIAGVNLTLGWKIGTALKQSNGSRTFFVRGDGQVVDLN